MTVETLKDQTRKTVKRIRKEQSLLAQRAEESTRLDDESEKESEKEAKELLIKTAGMLGVVLDDIDSLISVPAFANERELAEFEKSSREHLYRRYVSLLLRGLELLAERLEGKEYDLKELVMAVNAMATQARDMRPQQAGKRGPKSMSELDAMLEEARQEASRLGLKPPVPVS